MTKAEILAVAGILLDDNAPDESILPSELLGIIEDVLNYTEYKSYVVYLSQAGTSAPNVVVVNNTIGGDPVLARTGVGNYTLTITGGFTQGKTISFPGNMVITTYDGAIRAINISRQSVDVMKIVTYENGTPTDSILSSLPIEIRVYN